MTIKHFLSILILALSLIGCKNNDPLSDSGVENSDLQNIGKNIDQYLMAIEAIGFSGAIVVEHQGKKVLSKGYGFANRAERIPFTPQTVQSNGSNTKQFTGAAILLLESRGQLSVKDRLSLYFENIPQDKQQITLHQLLTHSSGLIQGVGPDEESIEFEPFFEKLMTEPLAFEPGTSYNYSNAGYSLLAKIIEQVSGVNYETFLFENLLKPTGILKTGYVLPYWNKEMMAMGYRKGEKRDEVAEIGWIEDGPSWHFRGNGGLFTTAEDMYQWFTTLKGKGVLDKNSLDKWTTGYVTENNGNSKYGYGLVSYEDDKWGKVITHNGSTGTFTSAFFWLPEAGFFFYIHANNSIIPAYSLEDDLLNAAFEKDFRFPPIIDFSDSNDIATVKKKEGIYQNEKGSIQFMSDGTRLIGKITGQGALDLMFSHDNSQIAKFASLNTKTQSVMNKLAKGDENACREIVASEEASKKVGRSFLNRIAQMRRNLESLNVIGSFENVPGSQLYKHGRYTTFVHARFKNWNQYWNLVWNEDGHCQGNFSGPWPEFTFVPIGEERFQGIRATLPWNTIPVKFKEDCLLVKSEGFCRKEIEEE